jgi:hypothetical protein
MSPARMCSLASSTAAQKPGRSNDDAGSSSSPLETGGCSLRGSVGSSRAASVCSMRSVARRTRTPSRHRARAVRQPSARRSAPRRSSHSPRRRPRIAATNRPRAASTPQAFHEGAPRDPRRAPARPCRPRFARSGRRPRGQSPRAQSRRSYTAPTFRHRPRSRADSCRRLGRGLRAQARA